MSSRAQQPRDKSAPRSGPDALAEYREQLETWARALSLGDIDALRDAVEPGFRSQHVIHFVDGNKMKRAALLEQFLKFVAPVFDDLAEIVDDFVAEHPFQAHDSPTADSERCLQWISETRQLTPTQQDYVACQRARHAVEFLACEKRIEHIRFQELLSLTPELLKEIDSNDGITILLNPLLAWTRFHTPALLEDSPPLPSDVVFYATGGGIRSATVNETARLLLEELEQIGPTTFDAWALRSSHADRDALRAACVNFAQQELIALC